MMIGPFVNIFVNIEGLKVMYGYAYLMLSMHSSTLTHPTHHPSVTLCYGLIDVIVFALIVETGLDCNWLVIMQLWYMVYSLWLLGLLPAIAVIAMMRMVVIAMQYIDGFDGGDNRRDKLMIC